jgi:hypothetical protein
MEYVTHIADMRIIPGRTPVESSAECLGLRQYVSELRNAVSGVDAASDTESGDDSDEDGRNGNGVKIKLGYSDARFLYRSGLTKLHMVAATHPHIRSLAYMTKKHQVAKFDLHDGVFHGLVEARFPMEFNEQLLYIGSLRRLCV